MDADFGANPVVATHPVREHPDPPLLVAAVPDAGDAAAIMSGFEPV
ncbi:MULTISPECIES: hypothetical protein [Halobacterium]|uniref:Uncharacterized protein n=1 Tax=Halobacterium salinarum TaxID=2242 RepID=A0A841HD32_HALSI|nr:MULTISPECIES: hypothetical protein [Halobacterium]MBB6090349.1 hypothetical protein [Halobacterium salinarum]MDL0118931.1 hypothetical protein [Halobacterium salinarum]MDL0123486.1 hypothetical protein [Halobacterium salinarum]MDL0126160.1 hypothetical protein [Halobacterium salinarum]MDL0128780.1 hypothetical protein [Halobacterium salinarum]